MKRFILALAFIAGGVTAYLAHDAIGGRYHRAGWYRVDGMTGTVSRVTSPELVPALGEYSTFAEFR